MFFLYVKSRNSYLLNVVTVPNQKRRELERCQKILSHHSDYNQCTERPSYFSKSIINNSSLIVLTCHCGGKNICSGWFGSSAAAKPRHLRPGFVSCSQVSSAAAKSRHLRPGFVSCSQVSSAAAKSRQLRPSLVICGQVS